jgi:hypothetical protein
MYMSKLGPASKEELKEQGLQTSGLQASCEKRQKKRHSDGKNEKERTQASGEMKRLDRILCIIADSRDLPTRCYQIQLPLGTEVHPSRWAWQGTV